MVYGLGFGVQVVGLRVWYLGLRVRGLKSGVEGAPRSQTRGDHAPSTCGCPPQLSTPAGFRVLCPLSSEFGTIKTANSAQLRQSRPDSGLGFSHFSG